MDVRSLIVWMLLVALHSSQGISQEAGDSRWSLQPIPATWRGVPQGKLAPINGFSWYRALVFLPQEWKEDELTIHVESMDDARSTYLNGVLVGASGTFPPQFRSGLGENGKHTIDPSRLKFGDYNTFAIRVYQSDPRPNFSVAPPAIINVTKRAGIRLEGTWQYQPGDDAKWSIASIPEFNLQTSDDTDQKLRSKGIYRTIDVVDDIEKYLARREGDTDPLSPQEAVRHFQTPADLEVQLVVGDPDIAQPLFMTWDERGRMWLAEYRQYPEPAGLTMVSRDAFLRSVYDKVPPPPPNHFVGKDRISIHEDTNGDGIYDVHKTFVEGLSLASSVAVGRGGVYVTNPPYLLFYPDADRNDVPDGDPEVLLEGFGIEDSHSVINSLRFGPDGWLYGAQGSTVSAAVKRLGSQDPPIRTVGQLIWRFHPETKVFEVFAEGGGNTFGCEIDSKGRVFSGHNGGDTRGFHYVQGGYYRKGFGKHGPLSNPYAYGFFENIKHHSVARFTHNFIVYEDTVLPDRYRGKLMGIEPLQGQVVLSKIDPYQSSFQTEDIERIVKTDDPWFRPVDIKTGPDGCVYVADMYEQRIDHSSHYAGRVDRTNGRVYRIKPKGMSPPSSSLAGKHSDALLAELNSPVKWRRQTALRLLGDQPNRSLSEPLFEMIQSSSNQLALEALWALHANGGLDAMRGNALLRHSDPFVRSWTCRLLVDSQTMDEMTASILIDLAHRDPSLEVRKQIACSARRMTWSQAIPLIARLAMHDEDADDIHQPLLVWWALESHLRQSDQSILMQAMLPTNDAWNSKMMQNTLLERWMKRYSQSGRREDLLDAAKLLAAAPNADSSTKMLRGFEDAYQGRSLSTVPQELLTAIDASGGASLPLRLRQGKADAVAEALQAIQNTKTLVPVRKQLIEIMGQTRSPQALPILFDLLEKDKDASIKNAVIGCLVSYDDPSIASVVIRMFASLDSDGKLAAESLLASRSDWAKSLLKAMDAQTISENAISIAAVRRMNMHQDAELAAALQKRWGNLSGASSVELFAEIDHVRMVLQSGTGNPKQGKIQFQQHCGRCHRLFEEGGSIGPDLTPFDRANVERMLMNVINPNLEIREGFENYIVTTSDGRILNGFLADKDSQIVVLRGADGQNMIVSQSEIETMKAIPQSVMPEGTLKPLSEQQIRDLFAYLRSSQPVN